MPSYPLLQGITIGRCIYCDRADVRLTREHIIPRSLGGDITLKRASCDKCAEITKLIEQKCGREIFHDVRAIAGLPMTERPTALSMLDTFSPTPKTAPKVWVPVEDHPGFLSLPLLFPARLISGAPDDSPRIQQINFRLLREVKPGKTPGKIYRQFDFGVLARLLAKIALGLSVRMVGLDGFDPRGLRKVITGEDADWHRLIGGTTQEMDEFLPVVDPAALYRMAIFSWNLPTAHLLIQFQFFANLLGPYFTIVCGQLTDLGLARLNEAPHQTRGSFRQS